MYVSSYYVGKSCKSIKLAGITIQISNFKYLRYLDKEKIYLII